MYIEKILWWVDFKQGTLLEALFDTSIKPTDLIGFLIIPGVFPLATTIVHPTSYQKITDALTLVIDKTLESKRSGWQLWLYHFEEY